jgi:hypothetical protein
MTNQHPITPPFDLVKQWAEESPMELSEDSWAYELFIAHQAARWGADQELEACCMWITREKSVLIAEELGIARRPKLPTLKEQALEALKDIECKYVIGATTSTIRRALEALPND